ncbi:hypothetical protein ACFLTU_10500 [Bacteroidota bacterium]
MKDLNKIEHLLERYYRGETSTNEENMLRQFFSGPDVPDHLQAEAELFGFFAEEKKGTLSGEMENRLDMIIAGSKTQKLTLGMKSRYYWISGAAAVIIILLGIFVDMQIRRNSPLEVRQDTFEDPYLAYVEAKKVLYMVSEKMNTGTKPLKNLEKMDAGINYMYPVFSFGAGIQHLEHLSTIEKTKKLISK